MGTSAGDQDTEAGSITLATDPDMEQLTTLLSVMPEYRQRKYVKDILQPKGSKDDKHKGRES